MEIWTVDDGWLSNAERCPSTHYNERPVDSRISLLVVHNISLPPGCFGGGYVQSFFTGKLPIEQDPYFETIKDLRVSAHCLIERDGKVTQFVPFNSRAWHAGDSSFLGMEDCNNYSIGVELEGADDVAYTQAQYDALARLTCVLMREYPEINEERLVGHSDIAPSRKTDPGAAFNWSEYKTACRELWSRS